MKNRGKLLIIAIILIAIIGVLFSMKNTKKNVSLTQKESNRVEERYVQLLEDGTRKNTSSKLHETKKIDGMEISNFQLTEKNNVTLLLGTITNTSSETKGGYPVIIKVMDEQGKEIITVEAFIGKIKSGESTQLSTSTTFDCANSYDFSISKKEIK